MAESETTSRSTEITSPKARTMPEKAEGTGLSRTPKESWAEACMTQSRPSDTMNALRVLPLR